MRYRAHYLRYGCIVRSGVFICSVTRVVAATHIYIYIIYAAHCCTVYMIYIYIFICKLYIYIALLRRSPCGIRC